MLETELAAEVASERVPEAPVANAPRPQRLGFFFWCCIGWLVILAIVTAFAPLLHLQDPIAQQFNLNNPPNFGKNANPSFAHWLGQDQLARDILSRVIFGARVSLVISLCATAIGVVIGAGLGMLAAYLSGKFDAVLTFFMYSFLAFPSIVAVLALLAFWGRSELHVIIVIGAFSIPLLYRVMRASTLSCATREYVTAARSQGARAMRVLLRDIFPNVLPSLIAYAVFTIGGVIAVEGALGVLGVGIESPTPTWGNMLNDAFGVANGNTINWSLLLTPSLAICFTLIALNYAGERIRTRFDPSEHKL